MHNKPLALLLCLLCLIFSCAARAEDEAPDLTAACLINGFGADFLTPRDHDYQTWWEPRLQDGVRAITLTAPQGQTLGGVFLRWNKAAVDVAVQVPDENGEWQTISICDDGLLEPFIPLPGVKQCRLIGLHDPQASLAVCEMTIIGEGAVPAYIHQWEKAQGKMDMLVLSGHPDDEVIWFGGMLPTYAGQEHKRVLVACATVNYAYRRHELMDCLWTCGVTIEPVFCGFPDLFISEGMSLLAGWGGRDRACGIVTELIRRFQPDVLVLHDVDGEYSHDVHIAYSLVGRLSAQYAADPDKYPEQLEALSAWQVKKVYIHLLGENENTFDWKQPLDAFGGMTSLAVAQEAMKCHVSQYGGRWDVWDGGRWDNSRFGLYFSAVGPDVLGGDMFENLR